MTNIKQEVLSSDLFALITTLSRYSPNAEAYLEGWIFTNKDKYPAVCKAIRERAELLNNLPI